MNNRIIYKRFLRTAATTTRKSRKEIKDGSGIGSPVTVDAAIEHLVSTNGVSNVPAFLTEHLRRRLSSKPDNQAATKTSKTTDVSKSLQVGERLDGDDIERQQFVPEALSGEGRQAVLETMRGYIGRGEREFMMSMQEVYTAEDWNWLLENLPEEKSNQAEKPKEQQAGQRKSSN